MNGDRRRNEWLIRAQAGATLLQKAPHGGVSLKPDRVLICELGLGDVAGPRQEISARGPIGLILRQAAIDGDLIERRKPLRRTVRLR
jgi:hypothetical protein